MFIVQILHKPQSLSVDKSDVTTSVGFVKMV